MDLEYATLEDIEQELAKRFESGVIIVQSKSREGSPLCSHRTWGNLFTVIGLLKYTENSFVCEERPNPLKEDIEDGDQGHSI